MIRAGQTAAGPKDRLGSRLLERLDHIFMPQTCVVCNVPVAERPRVLCDTCMRALTRNAAIPYCGRCGRSVNRLTLTARDCGWCRAERHWNTAGLVRIGTYPPELRQLLIDLKYSGRQRGIGLLSKRLADCLRDAAWFDEVEALVPVPMHWFRRAQRYRNHARVLAKAVGLAAGIPVINACRSVRYRPSQTCVSSAHGRFQNVKDCFAIRRRARVRGLTVCIIDNLMSTGATVHEVSKVLRKAGAGRIYAAVAARTVSADDFQTPDDVFSPGGDACG